ncbi:MULTISPECIES: porin [Paraburkholderia]|uniref:porin n=1 Tax=Paraburkholderia TaxID=1822464 RepID=UPI00210E0124|nr:porin [Paraburkholderia nodosa]
MSFIFGGRFGRRASARRRERTGFQGLRHHVGWRAQAQTSVTLYGVIDNGIEYQNGGSGGVVRTSSGGMFATVYGLIGHEDIGGGVHVNFQLEQGFSAVNGAAQVAGYAFNRLAWVGMSGSFGEFRIGRQKKPQYLFIDGETRSACGQIDRFVVQRSLRRQRALEQCNRLFHADLSRPSRAIHGRHARCDHQTFQRSSVL